MLASFSFVQRGAHACCKARGAHMYLRMMHDRPTSWPAPSGMISTRLRCTSGPSSALRFAIAHRCRLHKCMSRMSMQ